MSNQRRRNCPLCLSSHRPQKLSLYYGLVSYFVNRTRLPGTSQNYMELRFTSTSMFGKIAKAAFHNFSGAFPQQSCSCKMFLLHLKQWRKNHDIDNCLQHEKKWTNPLHQSLRLLDGHFSKQNDSFYAMMKMKIKQFHPGFEISNHRSKDSRARSLPLSYLTC